jgi:hypothetical protein
VEFGDVRCGIVGPREVGEEEARGLALENCLEGFVPERQIDVGRGRSRINVREVVDADAARVADESDALVGVEIGDVMRGVAGRIGDVEFAGAKRECLAAFEDLQIFLRDGKCFAKEDGELVAPEAGCAGDEFGWVGHVTGAVRVDVDFQIWIFADEFAAGAGVIEMDVGEEDGVEIGDREAVLP